MALLTPEQREQIARQRAEGGSTSQGVGLSKDPTGEQPPPRVLPTDTSGGYQSGFDPRLSRPGIAYNTSYQDQMRARQQALIDRLHNISTGKVKSPAQELFEQQVGQAQNQNVSTSSSLRDVGPGGQAQIAEQNRGLIQGQGTEQGAILQKQQKQQAESAMAQLYEQQRQGDLAAALGASENELMNRNLDDTRDLNEIERLYGVDVKNTNQQQDLANTRLGFGVGDDQSYKNKTGSVIQAGAGAFGYLNSAAQGLTQQSNGGATKPEDMNKPNYGWGGPGA